MANNTLLASDDFASGSLAAGWTPLAWGSGSSTIVVSTPNYAQPTASGAVYGQVWSGLAWPNDQVSEVTLNSVANSVNATVIVLVRSSSAAQNGYELHLQGGQWFIIKFVAGVATTLNSGAALPAPSAGDVLTFSAVGAVLTFFYNGKFVAEAADTTFSSGKPGFDEFTTLAASNVQIRSWRGYSSEQQDGVWLKKGVVVPAVTADLNQGGLGVDGTSNPFILFDSNPQILPGPNVYKMWFAGGSDICYAESSDGLSWTRSATRLPVTNGPNNPIIIKVGSTYNMYVQHGFEPIFLHTSTDGLTWSAGAQVFDVGTAGQWDDTFIAYFSPFLIDVAGTYGPAGTWYAYYAGTHSDSAPFAWAEGLATSLDGITWTRHVGNPLVSNAYGFTKPINVGGTWYVWGNARNPGQNTGSGGAIDPGEGVRLQTTDLIHFTNIIHSTHHSQLWEGVNDFEGGNYPNLAMDVNGVAIIYASCSNSDSIGPPHIYQITAAVAPVSIAKLVTHNEDALTQLALDNFTRADENPLSDGGKWATVGGGQTALRLVSNNAQPSVQASSAAMVFSGAVFSNDQYSSVTLGTLTNGSDFVAPIVRGSVAANTFYYANVVGPLGSVNSSVQIHRVVAGVDIVLGPNAQWTPLTGDVVTLSVVGNVISFFQNGYLVLQVEDNVAGAITTGRPGMGATTGNVNPTSNATATQWSGGNANAIPVYSSGSLLLEFVA